MVGDLRDDVDGYRQMIFGQDAAIQRLVARNHQLELQINALSYRLATLELQHLHLRYR